MLPAARLHSLHYLWKGLNTEEAGPLLLRTDSDRRD